MFTFGAWFTFGICSTEDLEKCDGDIASGVGQGRVAGFVELEVFFSVDDMEKVALLETQFKRGSGLKGIRCANDLQRWC